MSEEEKEAPWVKFPKWLIKEVPNDRAWSKADAGACVLIDENGGNPNCSISGYAKQWRWSRRQVRKLLGDLGFEIQYPKSKSDGQFGKIVPKGEGGQPMVKDSNELRSKLNSKRRERAQKSEGRTTPGQPPDNPSSKISRSSKANRTASGQPPDTSIKNRKNLKKVPKEPKGSLNGFSKTAQELMEYWNKQIPLHSSQGRKRPVHLKPETKVYRNSVQMIEELLKGTFWRSRVLDEEWAAKNGVTANVREKEWPHQHIRRGLNLLARLYVEGYWPKSKAKLPRSLPDLLYNSSNGTSFFFQVVSAGLTQKPIKEQNISDGDRLWAKIFLRIPDGATDYDEEKVEKFAARFQRTFKQYEKWFAKNADQLSMIAPFPQMLVEQTLIPLMEQKNWLNGKLGPGALSPTGENNFIFQEWVKQLEDGRNLKLD